MSLPEVLFAAWNLEAQPAQEPNASGYQNARNRACYLSICTFRVTLAITGTVLDIALQVLQVALQIIELILLNIFFSIFPSQDQPFQYSSCVKEGCTISSCLLFFREKVTMDEFSILVALTGVEIDEDAIDFAGALLRE